MSGSGEDMDDGVVEQLVTVADSSADDVSPAPPPPHLVSDHVTLQVSVAGDHATGSSCVRQRTVVDYAWQNRHYGGRIVATHGSFLAYAIGGAGGDVARSGGGGVVRVLDRRTQRRALLKSLAGAVIDLQFASCSSQVLLAVADASGALSVATVETDALSAVITVRARLTLCHSGPPEPTATRVLWCPYVPDPCEDTACEEAWRLLLWSHGRDAELVNVATLLDAESLEQQGGQATGAAAGGGRQLVTQLEDGVVRLAQLPALITDTCFSPDSSALAVATADGFVRFYQTEQADGEGLLLVLHQWRPHPPEAGPLTALRFLDNCQQQQEGQEGSSLQRAGGGAGEDGGGGQQFWRAALTAARDGHELRVWSCHDWRCLQTVRISPICASSSTMPSVSPLQVHVDPGARHVVLSDRQCRRLLVLDLVEEAAPPDGAAGGWSDGGFRLTAPRSLLLMNHPLSLVIRRSCPHEEEAGGDEDSDGSGAADGEDSDGDSSAAGRVSAGRRLICFIVQPRSLQHTTLVLQSAHTMAPPLSDTERASAPGSTSASSTDPCTPEPAGANYDGEHDHDQHDVDESGACVEASLNLLTPEAFVPAATAAAAAGGGGGAGRCVSVGDTTPTCCRVSAAAAAAVAGDDGGSGPLTAELARADATHTAANSNGSSPSIEVQEIMHPESPVALHVAAGGAGEGTSSSPAVAATSSTISSGGNEASVGHSTPRVSVHQLRSHFPPPPLPPQLPPDLDQLTRECVRQLRDELQQLLIGQQQQLQERAAAPPAAPVPCARCAELQQQLHLLHETVVPTLAERLEAAVERHVQTAVAAVESRLERRADRLERSLTQTVRQCVSGDSVASSVAGAVTASVARAVGDTLTDQCRRTLSDSLLPAYERASRQLLQQLGASFAGGSDQLLRRLEDGPAGGQLRRAAQLVSDRLASETEARCRTDTQLAELRTEMRGSFQQLQHHMQQLQQQQLSSHTAAVDHAPQLTAQQLQQRVKQLVERREDGAALQLALSATDLQLLLFTCRQLPVSRVFSGQQQLQQPVLLSLVQQLSAGELRCDGDDSQLKLEYLRDALLFLEPADVAVRDHLPAVLKPLVRKLQLLLDQQPAHKQARNVHAICASLLSST